jgi:hypothetical protein
MGAVQSEPSPTKHVEMRFSGTFGFTYWLPDVSEKHSAAVEHLE